MGNKIRKTVIVVSLILAFETAFNVNVQAGRKKGYSTGAYSELEAGETLWDRTSDWLATAGKSDEEKAIIKSRRRASRKIIKARKTLQKKKSEILKLKLKKLKELKEREKNQSN